MRRRLLIGLALVVVGGFALRAGVAAWMDWINEPLTRRQSTLQGTPTLRPPAAGAQPGQPTVTPEAPPPTIVVVAASSAQVASPTPILTLTAVSIRAEQTSTLIPAPSRDTLAPGSPMQPGERRRVANTEGLGVALRAAPGGDRQPGKGYDEGATVTVLEQRGEWALIHGDDGREGWVLAATLVPQEGAAQAPTSTARPAQAPIRPTTQAAPPVAPATRPTTAAPTATPPDRTLPTERQLRVANTDGLGVALHTAPGGDRLPEKGYDEGATVTVIGQSGDWVHIRGADGRDGWVPAVTLSP